MWLKINYIIHILYLNDKLKLLKNPKCCNFSDDKTSTECFLKNLKSIRIF